MVCNNSTAYILLLRNIFSSFLFLRILNFPPRKISSVNQGLILHLSQGMSSISQWTLKIKCYSITALTQEKLGMLVIPFLKASKIQQPFLNVLLHPYSGFSVSSLWHFPLLSLNTMPKGQTATDTAETNLHDYKETYLTRFQIPIKKKKIFL